MNLQLDGLTYPPPSPYALRFPSPTSSSKPSHAATRFTA